MNPNAGTFLTISLPSYRQELLPVPKMQANPGSRTNRPRAAPNRSLITVTGVLNCATSDDSIILFFSGPEQPAP